MRTGTEDARIELRAALVTEPDAAARAAALANSVTVNSGAMVELRRTCWPVHQRLEKRLDIKQRFGERAAYRAHLQKMWGFCAALEARIAESDLHRALPDYPLRRKLPFLTRDLIALGVDAAAVARLDRCELIGECRDISAAFGSTYVLEGATLGGRTLLPLVETRLGLSAENGASFLASYGAEVTSMWSRFGAALETWCGDRERRAAAAHAALITFAALEAWLCEAAA